MSSAAPPRKRLQSSPTTPLTRAPDVDGDSTMQSSADEDEMFPDEAISNNTNNPVTPMNTSVSNIAAELSPPNSQPGSAAPRDTTNLNANGKRPLSLAHGAGAGGSSANGVAGPSAQAHMDAESGYSWSKQEEQPGWEWRNPRAREEESRALDQMVDLGGQIKCKGNTEAGSCEC